jgi:hypothetical protein
MADHSEQPDVPTLKAWQAAYRAFRDVVGDDADIKLQYSIAWAACMNACMAYHRVQCEDEAQAKI